MAHCQQANAFLMTFTLTCASSLPSSRANRSAYGQTDRRVGAAGLPQAYFPWELTLLPRGTTFSMTSP